MKNGAFCKVVRGGTSLMEANLSHEAYQNSRYTVDNLG